MPQMQTAKSASRRHRPERTRSAPTSVDEYIARVPEPARGMLTKMRAVIRAAVPRDATEIISYRMPAFKRNVVLVWYAAFADHCSLFPGGAVLAQFKEELTGYKTSKGTVQFLLDEPLPVALVKRIVKARVAEHETKKRRR
jgi:uncharacterized protein YdhG (YjbR/CyaY superfamily)